MKIYIETYGCALNRADTNIIKTLLIEKKIEIVDSPREADVIILNTCVVRYDTEVRMLKRLEELSKTGKKIIVSGCMARALPIKIRSVNPKAVLLPPQSIHRIYEAINADDGYIFFDEIKTFTVMPKIIDGVKATIPVAEGCLDECSFCIVKIARPHLKSIPIENIVNAVKEVISMGAIEIEITAQDLSVYGYDIYGEYALPKLLESILEIEREDFVIRIGQLNPRHLVNYLDRFIAILRDPRVYKHVHIPVQSGNNRVLEAMNRKHGVELFLDIISELRKKIEGIQIATDIIVGHPGEDEEAFMDSVKLITENYIDRVHIARYSPRPLTRSSLMKQIPDPIKKSRSSYIEKIYEVVAYEVNREYIGSIAEVWITEIDSRRNIAIGRLFNYRPVVLDRGPEALGRKAFVEIRDATFYDLRGIVKELV
ncbi:RNA modification enzyme, MiaB family [Ignisphaera aggregans DSM 17230]|uniref:tRNA-t(6)A37 methylthiotransferase n=1 Tax=Ignisphaera aggregans (strain DSM 17230 / JCM 13409 / AQ1.S1) TaxID=583356 RepID=E0SNY3_IGNAA|nr:RNA modification enzyme, MiaB family [Ignisphaera aggregans DSM 17230]